MASVARYDQLVRLLLVGDQKVGKTAVLCQYANHEFHTDHVTTLGVDFRVKLEDVEGKQIKVQVWDTAGQERFLAITKQYYTRAQGCILVFDICSRSSFESLTKWMLFVKMYAPKNAAVVIIGNKTDLTHARQVPQETAQEFADENGVKYFETTATELESVKQPFKELCKQVLQTVSADSCTEDAEVLSISDEECKTHQAESKRPKCC